MALSAFSASPTTSAFWTLSSRYADYVSASLYTAYDGQVLTYTMTDLRAVKSTVTPTATPTSTSTYSGYYDDIELVYAYYPTGVIAESDLAPEKDYDSDSTTTSTYTYLEFSMPVTMTAPASCPTPFTITTTASVNVPSVVTGLVTPTSTEDGESATGVYGMLQYQTWYLTAGAAPFTMSDDYTYRHYMASCSTPPAPYRTGSTPSGGGGDDNDKDNDNDTVSQQGSCHYYFAACGTPIRTTIIVIATVIPGLWLLGFLESWFWFRRLMMGKSAVRFGTVCWVLISLWVLCFTRMQDRRSPEDQKVLQEKWKNMGTGAALKAWCKWGLRFKYPEEHLGQFSRHTVGIVPTGQPLYPAMAQGPFGFSHYAGAAAPPPGSLQPVPGQPGQVYYYGPPPPGWVQGPNGGFVPPQGYMYPPPHLAGYYGNMAKDGSAVSSSPVSASGAPQSTVSPIYPQAPQPVHPAPQNVVHMPAASPPPQDPVPSPPSPIVEQAPQLPPRSVPVSEAPNSEAPQPHDHIPPHPPPPKNDQNDRSLYE